MEPTSYHDDQGENQLTKANKNIESNSNIIYLKNQYQLEKQKTKEERTH